MDTEKFFIKDNDQNQEIRFYSSLGIKPKFKTKKPERYLTYCLIIDDLKDLDRLDMIITIKFNIFKDVPIDEIFKKLIKTDNSSILNNYKEIINYYSKEDMTESFFN